MKLVWPALVVFVVTTALAGLFANIAYEATRPRATGGLQFISDQTIWLAHTAMLAIVILPAMAILVLAAWRRAGRPLLVGLLAIVAVAALLSLFNYLDMASSPYEPKRAQQMSALTMFLAGLACMLPAYGLSFFLLRRAAVMRPLLGYDSGEVRPGPP